MNSNKIERRIISLVNYIIFILSLFSASVNAAPLSPADRDTIQQQQQQLLLQNQQQREELERSIPRPRLPGLCLQPAPGPASPLIPLPFPARPSFPRKPGRPLSRRGRAGVWIWRK
jgi:hypothetical protein